VCSQQKYAVALSAAQALQLPADCLIVATLQAHLAHHSLAVGLTQDMPPADRAAALEAVLPLLDSVLPALQRRRAAGTLEACALRPAEVAFIRAQSCAVNNFQANSTRIIITLQGYSLYLEAARTVVTVQAAGSPETTAAQQSAHLQFLASALDYVTQPRAVQQHDALQSETVLVDNTRELLRERDPCSALPALALVTAAWKRLQRSGKLEIRHMDDGIAVLYRIQEANRAAFAAEIVRRGLRCCGLAGCEAREVPARRSSRSAPRARPWCTAARRTKRRTGQRTRLHARRRARRQQQRKMNEGGASGAA
jgi:hypothetical protein